MRSSGGKQSIVLVSKKSSWPGDAAVAESGLHNRVTNEISLALVLAGNRPNLRNRGFCKALQHCSIIEMIQYDTRLLLHLCLLIYTYLPRHRVP